MLIISQLDSWVNRPMVSEMFRIVGYHIPQNAVCSPDRCLFLKIDINEYNKISFIEIKEEHCL